MIGGWIIDISDKGGGVYTFTCVGRRGVDRKDQIKIDIINPTELPPIGSECWWQSGKVYCCNDKLVLKKHGYSYGHKPRLAIVEGPRQ